VSIGLLRVVRLLLLNGQEKLEFLRQFVLGIQAIAEVYSANAAVCVNLNAETFDVVRAVGAACKIRQIKLNLIPSFVESHGHRANEGFHTRGRLVVARSKPPSHVLIIEHLHFESEIFFQIFDDHNEKRQFDSERFLRIGGTRQIIRRHVRPHNFEHRRLNVLIGDPFDVPISNFRIPNLQRLAPNRIKN